MKPTITQDFLDLEFMEDIKYFWQEKGDIERYASFDAERLAKLDPKLYKVWNDYKMAGELLDILTKD